MAKSTTCIICFIITILILGGVAVLIAWLADNLKSPMFFLDQATINGYNFTADNLFSATFTLTVRSHNRDSKYKIDYSVIVVSVYHSGYTLAYDTLGPYAQPYGEDIVFTARPTARNVSISSSDLAADIRNETRVGQLGFEVRIRAAVRYEVERWKHRRYTLRINCTPVLISLSSTRAFQGATCQVNRF